MAYNISYFVGDLNVRQYTGRLSTRSRWKDGGTIFRLWIGSYPGAPDMAGMFPDLATYDDVGNRIGVFHGRGRKVHAGGLYEMVVRNVPKYKFKNARYIRIFAGGYDAICLSALMISGYDGNDHVWTADTMIGCTGNTAIHDLRYKGKKRVGYMESTTRVGAETPKCLWIDRDNSYGLKVKGIELHLPDLIATPEKSAAWHEDPQLICHGGPRQATISPQSKDAHPLYWRKWVYTPPLEYEPVTWLDKDPTRITEWGNEKEGQLGPENFAEGWDNRDGEPYGWREPWMQGDPLYDPIRPSRPGNGPSLTEETPTDMTNVDGVKRMVPPPTRRQLVISNSTIPASSFCDFDDPEESDGRDYLSLQEKIYCDTSLRVMYPLCDEVNDSMCFDADTKTLRRYQGSSLAGNATALGDAGVENLIARSNKPMLAAPLFGMPYTNFLTLP